MSSWLWSIFYLTETEISSENAEQAQYRVNGLLQALSFFQVCLQFYFFLKILKHLKFKLTEEKYQASVEFYPDVLSQLDSDQGINNNNNNFICTQQYTEILARSNLHLPLFFLNISCIGWLVGGSFMGETFLAINVTVWYS